MHSLPLATEPVKTTQRSQIVDVTDIIRKHNEGNSDSHLKTSLVGNSATILIDRGGLVLGQWQGVYFCEFDGPGQREMFVKLLDFRPKTD